MTLLQISDTHNLHQQLSDLPIADVLVHCGDFTDMGTEAEVLNFLNWFIDLPFSQKIFVTGNHDLCLWDAEKIEDLPDNVHFLQDNGCEVDGVKFFGVAYNHPVSLIPHNVDVLITHEPPFMILDRSNKIHWGNLALKNRVLGINPQYHLFGHAHEAYGVEQRGKTIFANGSVLDDYYRLCNAPLLHDITCINSQLL